MMATIRAYVDSGRAKRVVVQYSPEQFAIYRTDNQQDEMAAELFGPSEPWLEFMRPHYRRYLLDYWRTIINNPDRLFGADATQREAAPVDPTKFTDQSFAEQQKSAAIRVQLQAPLPPGPAVDQLINEFFSTIDNIRARKVDVCVVEYPLSSAYRLVADRVETFRTLRMEFRQITAGKGIRFVDLTDKVPDELFANADHIAGSGRGLVTRLVLTGCFGPRKD